jgi:hypothetical protein
MSDEDIEQGKQLGRMEAIGEAHTGLGDLLKASQYVVGPDFEVYLRASAVATMLNDIVTRTALQPAVSDGL